MIQAKSAISSGNAGAIIPSGTKLLESSSSTQVLVQNTNSAQKQRESLTLSGGAQTTKENTEFPTLAAAAASGKSLVDSKGQSKIYIKNFTLFIY